MATIMPESAAYRSALTSLGLIAQQAYSDINPDMLLDIVSDISEYNFIKVTSKTPNYTSSELYDFNIIGKTLIVNQTTYGEEVGISVLYDFNKNTNNILTSNTPEVTDDPITVYSRTDQEFAQRTLWRSNFYL